VAKYDLKLITGAFLQPVHVPAYLSKIWHLPVHCTCSTKRDADRGVIGGRGGGEFCCCTGKQGPRGGKINYLNENWFSVLDKFKLLKQIERKSINYWYFLKLVIYVRGGHCDYTPMTQKIWIRHCTLILINTLFCRECFPGLSRPRREDDHSPSSTAKIINEGSNTFPPPISLLEVHRHIFNSINPLKTKRICFI
jgi:hypothetical protein